ncbi:MAG: hypothetical protein ACOYBD_11745 [Bilifractor sp.]|jgi:DNA invertase Pin-like site-specific DNA recombinase
MAVCVYNYGEEKTGEDLIRRICGGIYDSYDLYCDSERDNLAYRMMKQSLSKEKGIVITSCVSNLGRNKAEILEELKWMLRHHVTLAIARYPVTCQIDSMTNTIALKTLINVFENLINDPSFEIRSGSNAKGGRKKINFPENWYELYPEWTAKKITAVEFMKKAGVRKGTFYHLVKEYQSLLSASKQTMYL